MLGGNSWELREQKEADASEAPLNGLMSCSYQNLRGQARSAKSNIPPLPLGLAWALQTLGPIHVYRRTEFIVQRHGAEAWLAHSLGLAAVTSNGQHVRCHWHSRLIVSDVSCLLLEQAGLKCSWISFGSGLVSSLLQSSASNK